MNTIAKKFIAFACCVVFLIGVVWLFGLFPVSRINGEYLLYRIYSKRVNAFERFETKNRLIAGKESPTPAEQEEIRKMILQNLITEHVFRQYAEERGEFPSLKESADAVVASTIKEADPNVLPQATKEVYGWSVEEFVEHVLFPQAFQNKLREKIEGSGTSFDEFARTQLHEAEVRLYTVPWKWENGSLAGK